MSPSGARSGPNARRMSSLKSGMAEARDAIERDEKRLPHAALAREHLAASRRQSIVPAAPLARPLHPAAFDEAVVFKTVEGRIERRDVEGDRARRPRVDQAADLVAVARALVEEREDQELGAAAFQLAFEERRVHMWAQRISQRRRKSNRGGRDGKGRRDAEP